jgi:hypothetical protein
VQSAELNNAIRAALDAETTEDDSHPSPKDRFRLGARVQYLGKACDGGPVWALFNNPEAIRDEMHKVILDRVEESYDIVRDGKPLPEPGPAMT